MILLAGNLKNSERLGADKMALIEDLYLQYSATVYTYCLKKLKKREDAKDVTQETYLLACKLKHNFSETNHLALSWLLRIANNVCRNLARSKSKSEISLNDSNFEHLFLEEVQEEPFDLYHLINQTLNDLNHLEKEMIKRFLLYDESKRSIARQTGVSVSTLKRALKKVRDAVFAG